MPPKGVKPRVIFLGGSTVRNAFNQYPNVDFRDVIARKLAAIEVLNLGVAGSTTTSVRMLVHHIDVVQPDLLVIQSGHNDYNMSLFRGEIHAVSLWTLPIERALSRSWIRAWLEPMHGMRPEGQPGRVLPIEDDLVLRMCADVDARFHDELADAIADSPVPDGIDVTVVRRVQAACGRSSYGEWARPAPLQTPRSKSRRGMRRSTSMSPPSAHRPAPTTSSDPPREKPARRLSICRPRKAAFSRATGSPIPSIQTASARSERPRFWGRCFWGRWGYQPRLVSRRRCRDALPLR